MRSQYKKKKSKGRLQQPCEVCGKGWTWQAWYFSRFDKEHCRYKVVHVDCMPSLRGTFASKHDNEEVKVVAI